MTLKIHTALAGSLIALAIAACSDQANNHLDTTTKEAFEASVSQLAQSSSSAQSTDLWKKYETIATEIKTSHDSASFSDLKQKSQSLTQLSTELLPKFIAHNQECEAYLSVAMNSVDVMLNLSLEQIEADYHADGKLPPMNDVKCYHAKDLLVHPATAAVIAGTMDDTAESRSMISAEITEVLEHLEQVKQSSVR